jgi:hypothetical protein
MEKTFIVFLQLKDQELLLFLVPVSSDAFKASGAIVEPVGHDADFGFLDGDNMTLEERELGHLDLL